MKNLSFTLLLLAAMFNSTLATDLSVSEGGGGGAYATITDALNAAAASGDRIIIMPKAGGATYNESLTITKSVQLLSGTEGVYWRMQGNITFNPAATGSILNIVGMNNLVGNIVTTIAAPGASRSSVRILGCAMNSGFINFNFNNYELTCESDSLMAGYINLSYGKVVGSYINTSAVSNTAITIGNSDVNATNDYVYVVGNKIVATTFNSLYAILCTTSKHYFYISNNFILTNNYYQVALYASNSKTGLLENQVLNNTIKGNTVTSYWTFDFVSMNSPVVIHSNVFGSNLTYGITSNTAINTAIGFNHFATTVTQMLGGLAVNSGTNTQSTFTIDAVSGAATSGAPINGGNPDFGHYDLNLTVNDAGTGGGSYTIAQFHPIASSTGSRTAFVIAPRRVVTGQNFTINADGFDK